MSDCFPTFAEVGEDNVRRYLRRKGIGIEQVMMVGTGCEDVVVMKE